MFEGISLASVQEVRRTWGPCALDRGRLSGGVHLAVGAELRRRGHEGTGGNHEVGVGVEVLEGLKSGNSLLEPASNGVVRTEGGVLGEPDGLATAGLVGSLEVLEQGLTVLNLGVPVDVAEVVLAAGRLASRDPALEPGNTLTGKTAVADGGSTDESLARVAVEKLDVGGSSALGGHVGLTTVVGLVEAEDGLGAVGEALVDVLLKVLDLVVGITPESGDVVHTLDATRGRTPVVSPATVRAAGDEGVGQLDIVVGNTTLVREANGAAAGLGSGLGLGGGGLLGSSSSSGGSSGLSLLLEDGLAGDLGDLGRLGDLGESGRLDSDRGGSLNLLLGGLLSDLSGSSGGGSGGSRSLRDGAEVVVLPRDNLAVDGGSDPLGTLLDVLVVVTVSVEAESRLKESGGGGEKSELVTDHVDDC